MQKKYLFILFFLGFFNVSYASFPIVTSTSSFSDIPAVSYYSENKDTPSGSTLGLVSCSYVQTGATITSILYDGYNMTSALVYDNGANVKTETWYITNPSIGTHTMTITWSVAPHGSYAPSCMYTTMSNTASSPIGATNTSNNYTSMSLTSTASNSYIYNVGGSNGVLTGVANGQTLLDLYTNSGSFYNTVYAGIDAPAISTYTLNFTGYGPHNFASNQIEILYGSSATSSIPTYSIETVIPAKFISSLLFNNPVSTTTFSFISSAQTSSTKQAGLVFITHSSTTTPTVTWGGQTMTNLIDSTTTNNMVTSLFIKYNPLANASVVISGIVASSTSYISQVIYDNATGVTAVDNYETVFGSDIASVSLPSVIVPSTLVASMYTTDVSAFDMLQGSNLKQFATSTNGDFSLVQSSCNSPLDECLVGYSHPWSYIDTTKGQIVGIGLYGTTTITSSTSTDIYTQYSSYCNILTGFDIKGCLTYLFIPSDAQISNIMTDIRSSVLTHFPIGYITDIVTILSSTTTRDIYVIDATLPTALGVGGGQHITLSANGVLDPILNATTSVFNNASASSTETFYEITNRYWQYVVYIGLVLYLLYRLMGEHIIPSLFTKKLTH